MRASVSATRISWFLLTVQIIVAASEFPTKSGGTESSLKSSPVHTSTRLENSNPTRSYPSITTEIQRNFNDTITGNLSTKITPTNCKQGKKIASCVTDAKKNSNQSRGNQKLTIGEILLVCGFAFTFVVGVFGNAFVCYVFGYKQRKHRSVTETLFLYLGIVDLLASIVNPLLFTYWTITRYRRWDFGIVGCKILAPLAPITITISATIIIIISLDRYRAIVSPFKGRYSKKTINIIVAIGMALSIISYTAYFIHLEVVPNRTCLVPSTTALGNAIPYIVITFIRDIGYIILFCFTSFAIFTRLKVNEQLQANTDYLRKRRRASRKICHLLCCVGIVFAILVFPKDALTLASTISWLFPPGINPTPAILNLNAWFKVLNVSNSCVNVFIYSRMHDRFKKELRRLFGFCFKGRFNANESSNTMVTDDDYEDSIRRNVNNKPKGMMKESDVHDNDASHEKRSLAVDQENNERKREFAVKFVSPNGGSSEAEALIQPDNV